MAVQFKTGQVWRSSSEPELGSGHITECANRRVTVHFALAETTRVYAESSAPLVRLHLDAGEQANSESTGSFAVESIEEREGLFWYSGEGHSICESDLVGATASNEPMQMLRSGVTSSSEAFDLRLESRRQVLTQETSAVRGFLGGRIDLIPHQLYISSEVSARREPRVMLSDEVGLGKTIEACLILHRMLVQERISRVLIVLPEALMHQWFIELYRRFNLSFKLLDRETAEEGGQLLDTEPLVIAGLDVLVQNPEAIARALAADWDMLIVDEAHHLQWSPEEADPDYLFVEAMAQKIPSVLLLTATPEQLGRESHFARLRLLDPDRYPDLDQFLAEEVDYGKTAEEAEGLLKEGDEEALEDLLDRHGPGRVLYRNTRSNIKGFPERQAHLIPLDEDDEAGVQWLADFLKEDPQRKVLLICHEQAEAIHWDENLRKYSGADTALFHEDMSLLQRDRSAAWFADPEGARLLICSEIGGEGRNFQFAHDVVLADLPLNPELIEQRIGRLDRIGQTSDIQIWVPFAKGSSQEWVARWYHEGLNAFEHSLPGGRDVYSSLIAKVAALTQASALPALISESQQFRKKIADQMEHGRDRLMELHSFRSGRAEALAKNIQNQCGRPELREFLLKLLEHFGVYPEELDEQTLLFRAGDLQQHALPGFERDRLLATFSRARALAREDIGFITWDHPLVSAVSDALLSSEEGSSCLVLWPDEDARELLLEAVWVPECSAERHWGAHVYLPGTPLRLVIDQGLSERSDEQFPSEKFVDGRSMGLDGSVDSAKPIIDGMMDALQDQVRAAQAEMVVAAKKQASHELNHELDRLTYLAEHNDHIRPQEIEQLELQRDRVLEHLDHAVYRLDALRLIFRGG